MDANPLIGKTLTGVKVASDKKAILFQATDGDVIARCDGDCCSETWVESIENTVSSFPATVTNAADLYLNRDDVKQDYETIAFYGFKIETDKGVLVIDYRNSSNGYYGGSLCWPGDGHYGGVYGQNISTEEWQEID